MTLFEMYSIIFFMNITFIETGELVLQGAVGTSETQFVFSNAKKYDGTDIDATDFGDVQSGTIDPKTGKQRGARLDVCK